MKLKETLKKFDRWAEKVDRKLGKLWLDILYGLFEDQSQKKKEK